MKSNIIENLSNNIHIFLKGEIFLEYFNAFWVGGIICVIAQILIDKTKLTPARILVSYVIAGVILTALGIYEPIVEYAGAGATVPLSGFGYCMAKGVVEMIQEEGIIGIIAGGMASTAAGISAAVFFGYLASLVGRSSEKD